MTNNSIKIFPCNCCGEGLTVTVEKDVIETNRVSTNRKWWQFWKPKYEWKIEGENKPIVYINIAFWEYTSKNGRGNQLARWDRIKYAWHILRGKSPWTDMIMLSPKVARNFANHILYLLDKNRDKNGKQKPIFGDKGFELFEKVKSGERGFGTYD